MAEKIDHDQIFKVLIRSFFKDFMTLFLPEEAKLIDFRKVTFLEQEEFTDFPKDRKKIMDLVIKAGLKNGEEEYILIHKEFEARKPGDFRAFSERIYQYQCQLYLRYGKPVVSVVIFSDEQKWQEVPPGNFTIEVAGRKYVDFNYHLIKLKNRNWREFMKYHNPLAYALMAKMELDKKQRAKLKADFLNLVLRCRINPARENVLLNFIEKYVILNREEQKVYKQLTETDEKYLEVKKMITVYEEKGIEKGELKSTREDVLEVLKVRFQNIPYAVKEKINYCDNLKKLKTLLRQAIIIKSITDLKV